MQVHRELDELPSFRRPVLTIGSFDGVHLGHQDLLGQIRQRAEDLEGESVLVTFDPHPRHVLQQGGAPLRLLTTTAEKCERIAAQGIDHVVIVPFDHAFARQTAETYLNDFLFGRFQPHTVVIGYDHRYGLGRKGDISLLRQVAAQRQIEVAEIAARDVERLAVSSTRIRTAVADGRMQEAATLLGSAYPLSGHVVRGEAIGRTIGFPTANLDLAAPHKLLPADGVYAVHAHRNYLDKRWQTSELVQGMLYIGERPSLAGKRPRSIEVNLLDFDADLYGEMLRVEVIARVRDDQAFDSLEALRTQIARDRDTTLRLLAQTVKS